MDQSVVSWYSPCCSQITIVTLFSLSPALGGRLHKQVTRPIGLVVPDLVTVQIPFTWTLMGTQAICSL